MAKLHMWSQKEVITNTRWWFELSSEEKFISNLINCLMNRDPKVSYNAAAEQVQFFFILQFVIKLNVRSQENVLLYLFTCMHLADAFIQSDLHSGYTFCFFCQYMCCLGIKPTTFVLLTQYSTTEPQERKV